MDAADIASEREAIHREESLARARKAQASGPSLDTCENCGAPIPEARQRAVPGCDRCVTCQKEREE